MFTQMPMQSLRSRRSRGTLTILLTALITALSVAVASASATLPRSPISVGATHAHHGLQIKPKSVTYTGDGTGILSGANVHSSLRWSSWTSSRADGTGYNELNNCKPDCAGGHYTGYPVKLVMWRPRTLGGSLVFTRLTIFYTHLIPKGSAAHYTFTNTLERGTFAWGPPSAQGYCVHTQGQKPVAGCRNINQLP